MYNINNSDINEAIGKINSAMTVKGQIIGYSIAFCGKNIENRTRKIKDGYYALHIGGSKITTQKHSYIYSLIDYYDPKDLPLLSSIIGVFKIEGSITASNNPWFLGPIGNIITKYIHFNEPIINIPGHQSITYNLNTIDKKLYKKNKKLDLSIKKQIIIKLKNRLKYE